MASLAEILPFARHFAKTQGLAQVVWRSELVDTYGRTPLWEWNAKHYGNLSLRIVEIVQPDAK